MASNKFTAQVICTALTLLLSNGITLSSVFASETETVTHEVVKQSTTDMAKEAAAEVADSAKEKAIDLAKEQAHSAVDTAIEKVDETLKPAETAAEAGKEAAH